MSFTLEINVFVFIFLLMIFLGLQLQVSGLTKRIEELISRIKQSNAPLS